MNQPGLVGGWNGRFKRTVNDGNGLATPPGFTLKQPVPSKPEVAGVRRRTGPVGHGGREVQAVAPHDNGVRHDVLLHGPGVVPKLIHLDGHLTLEHPSFAEGFTLCPVVIGDDDVHVALSDPGHREAPLHGGRELNGEDTFVRLDRATGWKQQQSLVKGRTRAVHRGVFHAQSFVVPQFNPEFTQVAEAVGIGDGHTPADVL